MFQQFLRRIGHESSDRIGVFCHDWTASAATKVEVTKRSGEEEPGELTAGPSTRQ